MLSPLDDLPIHQIAEPVNHVGTSDRNFYDRYYFNVHHCDDTLLAVVGLGQYPNLGVCDAFVAVRRGDRHRVVRASRQLGRDRSSTAVGPIRVEVLEGLRRLRVVCEPNEFGIELDAVFEGSVPAHQEPRQVRRVGARIEMDTCRLAQVGSWQGHLRVGDEHFELEPGHWWGSRDRSWGVRPVGEPEPPGIRAATAPAGFFWVYAPMQFPDRLVHFAVQEDGEGRRTLELGAAVATFSLGARDEDDVVDLGRPEPHLTVDKDTREVTRAVLTLSPPRTASVAPSGSGASGSSASGPAGPGARAASPADLRLEDPIKIEVEILLPIALMLGTGYGLEADWRHGMWQGPLAVQGADYDMRDPANRPWGIIDNVARFTMGEHVGYGLFEYGILGPNDRYGFIDW